MPITYGDRAGAKKVRFILLIDTAMIHSYFDRMSNAYTYCMYLADRNGNPVDLDGSLYPDAVLPEVEKWVADVSDFREGTISIEGDELFIASDSIRFCGLKVVHIAKKSALTGDIKELRRFFTGVWFLCTDVYKRQPQNNIDHRINGQDRQNQQQHKYHSVYGLRFS